MQTKQEQLFRDTSVWTAICKLAVPAMISMVVMIFYNMADMLFVGQMGDTAQVAAVSIAGPVFTVMMAIGTMLGGGGCVLIARILGEKDDSKVKLYSSLCCWGSLVFGLIFTVLVLAFDTQHGGPRKESDRSSLRGEAGIFIHSGSFRRRTADADRGADLSGRL